jgi:hypothetical protein
MGLEVPTSKEATLDHGKLWRARLILMLVAAVAGIALVVAQHYRRPNSGAGMAATGPGAHAPSGATEPAGAPVAPVEAGNAPATPSGSATVPAPQEAAQSGDSTAACRKAPECSVDSDCDTLCGAGLGHCVHASCPIRICKCK